MPKESMEKIEKKEEGKMEEEKILTLKEKTEEELRRTYESAKSYLKDRKGYKKEELTPEFIDTFIKSQPKESSGKKEYEFQRKQLELCEKIEKGGWKLALIADAHNYNNIERALLRTGKILREESVDGVVYLGDIERKISEEDKYITIGLRRGQLHEEYLLTESIRIAHDPPRGAYQKEIKKSAEKTCLVLGAHDHRQYVTDLLKKKELICEPKEGRVDVNIGPTGLFGINPGAFCDGRLIILHDKGNGLYRVSLFDVVEN